MGPESGMGRLQPETTQPQATRWDGAFGEEGRRGGPGLEGGSPSGCDREAVGCGQAG